MASLAASFRFHLMRYHLDDYADFITTPDEVVQENRRSSLHTLHTLQAEGWVDAFEYSGPNLAKLVLTDLGNARIHGLRSRLSELGVDPVTDPVEIFYICRVALAQMWN